MILLSLINQIHFQPMCAYSTFQLEKVTSKEISEVVLKGDSQHALVPWPDEVMMSEVSG